MPGAGPSALDIELQNGKTDTSHNYVVVDLTPDVTRAVGSGTRGSLMSAFGQNQPSNSAPTVGVGDRISVRIWESSADGLFASAGGKSTSCLLYTSDAADE